MRPVSPKRSGSIAIHTTLKEDTPPPWRHTPWSHVDCHAKRVEKQRRTVQEGRRWWLRGRDLNPRPLGYACHYSFRCPANPVCGLDFLFTLGPAAPPLGCLPSSLYTFPESVAALRAWLGITPLPASPNLTGDHTEVSFCTAHCGSDCRSPWQSADDSPAKLSPTSYQTAPPRNTW